MLLISTAFHCLKEIVAHFVMFEEEEVLHAVAQTIEYNTATGQQWVPWKQRTNNEGHTVENL